MKLHFSDFSSIYLHFYICQLYVINIRKTHLQMRINKMVFTYGLISIFYKIIFRFLKRVSFFETYSYLFHSKEIIHLYFSI